MTDLRCAVEDYTVPRNPPMTCGFPAVSTATADDGSTVGVCRSCEPAVIVSGTVVTPIPEPDASEDWKLSRCVHCGETGNACRCPIDNPPDER